VAFISKMNNKHAQYAVATSFVLPDRIWLVDSFLSVWVCFATSATSTCDQLCLCESCWCCLSRCSARRRECHSIDDRCDGSDPVWSRATIVGRWKELNIRGFHTMHAQRVGNFACMMEIMLDDIPDNQPTSEGIYLHSWVLFPCNEQVTGKLE